MVTILSNLVSPTEELPERPNVQANLKHIRYQTHMKHTVSTVDFETPVCKLYLLFISADAAKEKEKREKSAVAHWCFKV